MASFSLTDLSPSILRIGVAVNCNDVIFLTKFAILQRPQFFELRSR